MSHTIYLAARNARKIPLRSTLRPKHSSSQNVEKRCEITHHAVHCSTPSPSRGHLNSIHFLMVCWNVCTIHSFSPCVTPPPGGDGWAGSGPLDPLPPVVLGELSVSYSTPPDWLERAGSKPPEGQPNETRGWEVPRFSQTSLAGKI